MTSDAPLPVVFEHALIEEVVLDAVRARSEEHALRRQRDRLYLIADDAAREQAFRDLHASWFDRLRLDEPLRAAVESLPVLSKQCRRCLVVSAHAARDEGADLLVASRDGVDDRTVVVRLRPAAFRDPQALRAMLRGELLHVADMLDPEFGYTPELPGIDAEPLRGRLLRDRYRTLWDVRIAGRLFRAGEGTESLRRAALSSFAATFPMLGPDVDRAFRRFFDGEARTHLELVQFAARPHGALGLISGATCPLCRFTAYDPEPQPMRMAGEVVERIRRDFPAWTPAAGLCRQCADLYRARGLSLAAAARLPG